MSLLLEALKKAELAKQSTAAQQGGESLPPRDIASSMELSLEPVAGEAAERPVMTRDRLPDITQPLDILSEDLPSAGMRRAPAPMPPPRAPEPAPITARAAPMLDIGERESRTMPGAAAADQERASARQLFEAKSVDYNPRRPFFIVVGVLVVAGVAVAGYFFWQIAGPRPSYYTGPAGGAQATQPIAAAPTEPPARPLMAAPAPPPLQEAPPSAPTAAVPAPPQPAPSTGTAPAPAKADTAPRSAAAASARQPAAATTRAVQPASTRAASPSPIAVRPATQSIDPGVEEAWMALQSGDLAKARDQYQRVLKANPLNRDAWLGLATIDTRNRDYESAEARYLRVLEIDPRDAYAQAGIIAMRGQTDPVQSESRLKNLLAQQPEAAFLNFALGNQYAAQGRWPEAQGAYFKAYSAESENADYAFNLAVSLDHLRQSKLALEYYRRALALAANRTVGFDKAPIETRILELQR